MKQDVEGIHHSVWARGNPQLSHLGIGNAVFGGGIVAKDATGRADELVRPVPIWMWPALLGGVGALVLTIVALVVRAPHVIYLAFLGFLTALFVGLTLVSYVLGRWLRRRRLVVDGARRVLQALDRGRPLAEIASTAMIGTRLQMHEAGDSVTFFDVLVTLDATEVWIHQCATEAEARKLAETTARLLGIAFDARIERTG